MPYATEIAVNGEKAPESHPFFNFKTDMELHEWIGDLNTLRNDSEALRNGDFSFSLRVCHDRRWNSPGSTP